MMEPSMPISEKERIVLYDFDFSNHEDFEFKINAVPLQLNVGDECYRDQLVSFFQLAPLIKKTVHFNEADYIIYGHPYARVEDFSSYVLADLEAINQQKKAGAEVIVIGKACNIKNQIDGKYDNITYVDKHYTEYLGKRFGIDMKDEYIVYDDRYKKLAIWPVDGCINKCGFCRRTYMNIPFESLPLEDIKKHLDWFRKNHPEQLRYVSLRAENLTQYGLDIYGEQRLHELIDLLNSYHEIKHIEMPIGLCIGEVTPEILESLCRCGDKLCEIALNLEAGSDRLLNVIGKGHTREQAIEVFTKIREYCPRAFIETTIMVGLPTEELIDIYELAELIEECKIDFVYCNYYGCDPKHPLAKYPQLSEGVRKMHMSCLVKLLKKNHSKDSPILEMWHERVLDESKRSVIREKEKREEEQKHTWGRILGPSTYENFIGFDASVRENEFFAFRNKSIDEKMKSVNKLAYQKRLSRLDQERKNRIAKKGL